MRAFLRKIESNAIRPALKRRGARQAQRELVSI